MAQTELEQIRERWMNKYPHVSITLYSVSKSGKYGGKMMTENSSIDLNADSIGELISQGESYLRKVI